MANRTNSSEYFWSYEYYWDYIDPIPVDGSKLEVNKYSIVIAFWVGLAAFVTFLFLILLLQPEMNHPVSAWKLLVSFLVIILISPNKCTLTSPVKAGELLPSHHFSAHPSLSGQGTCRTPCALPACTHPGERSSFSWGPCARASPPSQPRFPPRDPIQPCPLAVLSHSPCPFPPSLVPSLPKVSLEPFAGEHLQLSQPGSRAEGLYPPEHLQGFLCACSSSSTNFLCWTPGLRQLCRWGFTRVGDRSRIPPALADFPPDTPLFRLMPAQALQ
uniref:Melanocortin-2 receptor accessory protein n=1 Tax=Catharus ustulatus TaxID=91951 RepID=A0A8C3XZ37_CATUS